MHNTGCAILFYFNFIRILTEQSTKKSKVKKKYMMQPNMFWDFSVKNVYSVFKKIVNLAQLSNCSSCGCLLCSPDIRI